MLGQRFWRFEFAPWLPSTGLDLRNLALGLSYCGRAAFEIGAILCKLGVECDRFQDGQNVALLNFITLIGTQFQKCGGPLPRVHENVFARHE